MPLSNHSNILTNDNSLIFPPLQSIPDPQKCTVVFPHSQPTTGTIVQFEVYLKDTRGELCYHKSKVIIIAKLISMVDDSTTKVTLDAYTKVIATLSYKPTQRGKHHLTVSVNGEEVAKSPFSLYVHHPAAQLGCPVRVIKNIYCPYSVAITRKHHLVVPKRGCISVYNLHGKSLRCINSTRVAFDPRGVAISEDGMMFIADYVSHGLLKVNSNFKLLDAVGGVCMEFNDYDGIKVLNNSVYVCDRNNDVIHIFDMNLKLLHFFGTRGSGEGEFKYPCDIAADGDKCLYVVDRYNNRVQVFSQSGLYLRSFGHYGNGPGELCRPGGIHIHNKYVYITESGNHRVSVFTISGEFVSSFKVSTSLWRYGQPQGITVDIDGYIYVCDNISNTIYVY